jgi:hypothetical protein
MFLLVLLFLPSSLANTASTSMIVNHQINYLFYSPVTPSFSPVSLAYDCVQYSGEHFKFWLTCALMFPHWVIGNAGEEMHCIPGCQAQRGCWGRYMAGAQPDRPLLH